MDEEESQRIMIEMHKVACRGHHFWKATTHKILKAGYYWPTLYSDVFDQVISCKECQVFVGKENILLFPFKPISVEAPFQ